MVFLFRWTKKFFRKVYRKIRGQEWCLIHDNKKLFAKAGYDIYIKEHNLHVEGNDLHIISGKTDERNTCGTAREVLLSRDYNFIMTEPYVMFDIGFNIGLTSLYWARDEHVKQIYGFEPFRPTWEEGKRNLENNPELAKKIELYNFGLGDTEKEIAVHFSRKGNSGMSTMEDRFEGTKNCGQLERAQVKKASDILRPLFEKHSEKKFLKIDCEGSEKEIMPDLDKAGLLKDVSVIIMEWHWEEPHYLIDMLKDNFHIYCPYIKWFQPVGMIVAFKK